MRLAVIRFRTTTERPHHWLSRREQWRLLVLVFSLGLVILLIGEVRKPGRWDWFLLLTGEDDSSGADHDQTPGRDIDTRVQRPAVENSDPDVFISPGPAVAKFDTSKQFFPGVKPEYFEPVADHKVFHAEDHRAWFHLLDILADHDPEALELASTGEVSFGQLFEQPEVYRGRLVTIRGTVRRVIPTAARQNDAGVESYYQVVVRPAGGPDLPMIVYSLDLPEGFPTGEKVDEEVAVTGFFFKNTAYATAQEIHSYPTLLSRGLRWDRPKGVGQGGATDQSGINVLVVLLVVVLTAGIAAAIARWVYVSSQRVHSSARQRFEGSVGPFALIVLLAAGQVVADDADQQVEGPLELLALQGVDESVLAELADGQSLTDDDETALLKIIYAVRRFDLASIARWTRRGTPLGQLAADPDSYRGRLFALRGRVTRVVRVEPPADLAERFEMDAYYHCEMQLDSQRTASVLTSRVPKAWLSDEPVDYRATASGLFVKLEAGAAEKARLAFVARRIAWHPDKIGESSDDEPSGVRLGLTVLGGLGMDVGLWDEVQNRQAITGRDREAFYQLLDAVERLDVDEVTRLARRGLTLSKPGWQSDEQALVARVAELNAQRDQATSDDRRATAERTLRQAEQRLAGVRHALASAEAGKFSVAPLFNQPEEQFGRLMVLEGVARRALRVDISADRDVRDRFGIDHYFEVDIFTDDSQNNPIVFCVRHLPAGFPTGEAISEQVRLAGFFFKSWAFRSRRPTEVVGEGGRADRPRQLAPLLVAREPTWLQAPTPAPSLFSGLIAGGLFLVVLVVVWLGASAWGRNDRRFRHRVIDKIYSPETGTSLDDLHLGATGQDGEGPR